MLCIRSLFSWLSFALAFPVSAQVLGWSKEDIERWTPQNPYVRSEDGRPRVPDHLLLRMQEVPTEVAWGVLRAHGFHRQYVGGLQSSSPGRRLVGRVVTAQYLPTRPDVEPVYQAAAAERGMPKGEVQKVIDVLHPGDVPVISMMGSGAGQTFGGDNLHAAIFGRAGTGAVIDGRIRDLEGVSQLPTQVYFREADPSSVSGVMLAGINLPIRIGDVLILPGDLALGDRTGVLFIPPQLVQEIVDKAVGAQIFDEWTVQKFLTGQYKASELYGGPLSPQLRAEYDAYAKRRRAEIEAKYQSAEPVP